MRYPPRWETEPGHPPVPLRAALEIHLVHVYWGPRALFSQYHSPQPQVVRGIPCFLMRLTD